MERQLAPSAPLDTLPAGEHHEQQDSAPQLLNDIADAMAHSRPSDWKVPDASTANDVRLTGVWNVAQPDGHAALGFRWHAQDNYLTLTMPAKGLWHTLRERLGEQRPVKGLWRAIGERVIERSQFDTHNLTGAATVERAFADHGVDSGSAVAPLLYSALLRTESLANRDALIKRAEALNATSVGVWADRLGYGRGAIFMVEAGHVVRVDTDDPQITPGTVDTVRQILRQSAGALFFDTATVRLRLTSEQHDGEARPALRTYAGKKSFVLESDTTPVVAAERGEADQQMANHRERQVSALASAFHEDWRNTNQNPHEVNGTTVYDPRVKVLVRTEDGQEKWVNAGKEPAGSTEIKRQDIANTPYEALDPNWQAENEAAAGVVVDLLAELGDRIDLSDEQTRRFVGQHIHDAWLSRNDWARGGELDVPFDQLPKVEQDKDIDQMAAALRLFR